MVGSHTLAEVILKENFQDFMGICRAIGQVLSRADSLTVRYQHRSVQGES
jgi:hypothetical protein